MIAIISIFKKNRPLREERKLLPGDQLTFECTYDTSGRSNVTIAGFSTANEMCEVFVWYYPKIPMLACSSFYDITRLFPAFGIKKVKWVKGFNKDSQPTVLEPSHMENRTFAEYLDSEIEWSDERRGSLQNELHYMPHIADCGSARLPHAKSQTILQDQQRQYAASSAQNEIQPPESFPSNSEMPNPNNLPNNPARQRQQKRPRMPMPEFVTYPNVHDYKPFNECPERQKRLYM